MNRGKIKSPYSRTSQVGSTDQCRKEIDAMLEVLRVKICIITFSG